MHNDIRLCIWALDHIEFNWLCLACDALDLLCVMFICVTEEKRTAQSVRQRLWELLAPAGVTEASGSSPWLHDYRRLLQEEGADEETQKKAVLMQLWATQVS